VLGPAGHRIGVIDANPLCICRFSRWVDRVHPCPASAVDPLGYLDTVERLMSNGDYDALLPTHEQAWLFAAAGSRFVQATGVAVAPFDAFGRVQSKIEFSRLLDECGLPQPEWALVRSADDLIDWEPPYYLKAPFSTAGSGVRKVTRRDDAREALETLRSVAAGSDIMLQAPAEGEYAQVQAIFDRGRLVAAHTSAQTAIGIGSSAAGRVSVDHPFARRDVAMLGERLHWHGGLTLDYLYRGEEYVYIECNPRTVEPANAASSGVDLPDLQLRLSRGEHPDELVAGRPGVRTHSSLAILLGTAAYGGTRKAVIAQAIRLARHDGLFSDSVERLTPVRQDPPSAVPLLVTFGRLVISPRSAQRLAASAVSGYSVTAAAIDTVRAGVSAESAAS
jgi:hypothetical protein